MAPPSGSQLRIVVSETCSKPPVLLAPGKFLFKQQLKGLVSTLLSRPEPELKRSHGIFPLAKGENVLPADVCAEFANGFKIDGAASVTKVDLRNFKADSPFEAFHMFRTCSSLEEVDLSGLESVDVVIAQGMFGQCSKMKRIDLGNLDFGLTQSMDAMFGGMCGTGGNQSWLNPSPLRADGRPYVRRFAVCRQSRHEGKNRRMLNPTARAGVIIPF